MRHMLKLEHVPFRTARTVVLILSALAVTLPAPARAAGVPYFHDFLGDLCVREDDLETVWRTGHKGVRPPPTCLEDPCETRLDRDTFERQILGRKAEESEWNDYTQMWDLVCVEQGAPQSLTMLLPADPFAEDPIPTALDLMAEDAPLPLTAALEAPLAIDTASGGVFVRRQFWRDAPVVLLPLAPALGTGYGLAGSSNSRGSGGSAVNGFTSGDGNPATGSSGNVSASLVTGPAAAANVATVTGSGGGGGASSGGSGSGTGGGSTGGTGGSTGGGGTISGSPVPIPIAPGIFSLGGALMGVAIYAGSRQRRHVG